MLWKRFSRFRLIFLVIALLSVPLMLLYAQRRAPGYENTIISPIFDASLMFQKGFASIIGAITENFYALSAAFDSRDELIQLRAQSEEAKGLKIALRELQSENLRIKELIAFSAPFTQGRMIGSHVIGRTGSPLSRTLQIDIGRDHGVSVGDAVVSASGAVGHISRTSRSYSDVLLLTDASSAVDVLVESSRARGLLKGVSGARLYRMKVNDFDRLHEIKNGDLIVTSGMGAHFPPGVPVGEITSVKQLADSLYIEAEVKPFTLFDSIEEVVVLADGGLQKPWQRDEFIMEKLGQSIGPGPKKE